MKPIALSGIADNRTFTATSLLLLRSATAGALFKLSPEPLEGIFQCSQAGFHVGDFFGK